MRTMYIFIYTAVFVELAFYLLSLIYFLKVIKEHFQKLYVFRNVEVSKFVKKKEKKKNHAILFLADCQNLVTETYSGFSQTTTYVYLNLFIADAATLFGKQKLFLKIVG